MELSPINMFVKQNKNIQSYYLIHKTYTFFNSYLHYICVLNYLFWVEFGKINHNNNHSHKRIEF